MFLRLCAHLHVKICASRELTIVSSICWQEKVFRKSKLMLCFSRKICNGNNNNIVIVNLVTPDQIPQHLCVTIIFHLSSFETRCSVFVLTSIIGDEKLQSCYISLASQVYDPSNCAGKSQFPVLYSLKYFSNTSNLKK